MAEPTVSWTRLEMPDGRFEAGLIGARVTLAVTPRMFAAALIQYNSSTSTVAANLRFRWEYRPGSDLFVVYTEARDMRIAGAPPILARGVAIKFTRLFHLS